MRLHSFRSIVFIIISLHLHLAAAAQNSRSAVHNRCGFFVNLQGGIGFSGAEPFDRMVNTSVVYNGFFNFGRTWDLAFGKKWHKGSVGIRHLQYLAQRHQPPVQVNGEAMNRLYERSSWTGLFYGLEHLFGDEAQFGLNFTPGLGIFQTHAIYTLPSRPFDFRQSFIAAAITVDFQYYLSHVWGILAGIDGGLNVIKLSGSGINNGRGNLFRLRAGLQVRF